MKPTTTISNVVLSVAIMIGGAALALAQAPAPPNRPTQQQATGVYSGPGDATAGQSALGCQPSEGQAEATSPEELAQALDVSTNRPDANEAAGAVKNAVATCSR